MKAPRRTAQDMARLRSSPSVFQVALSCGGSAADVHVWMKRPVAATDDLVVKASPADVTAMFKFMVAKGVCIDDLHERRCYASSGEKYKWKFGASYYTKTVADTGRPMLVKCDQKGKDTTDDGHASDDDGAAMAALQGEADDFAQPEVCVDDLPAEDED